MILEAVATIALKLDGQALTISAGETLTVSDAQGQRILGHFKDQVREIASAPQTPLLPGWLIAYRDQAGRLRGGGDELDKGTVRDCRWDGYTWVVTVSNGETVPLRSILSVARPDGDGRVLEAWTVRAHGFDGKKGHG